MFFSSVELGPFTLQHRAMAPLTRSRFAQPRQASRPAGKSFANTMLEIS
jgi:hypothetical protein